MQRHTKATDRQRCCKWMLDELVSGMGFFRRSKRFGVRLDGSRTVNFQSLFQHSAC
jgi:hypothetical protein